MKWIVYRMTGSRSWETLGEVEARHQPAALRVAWERFGVADPSEQRKVFVRREQDRLPEERA